MEKELAEQINELRKDVQDIRATTLATAALVGELWGKIIAEEPTHGEPRLSFLRSSYLAELVCKTDPAGAVTLQAIVNTIRESARAMGFPAHAPEKDDLLILLLNAEERSH